VAAIQHALARSIGTPLLNDDGAQGATPVSRTETLPLHRFGTAEDAGTAVVTAPVYEHCRFQETIERRTSLKRLPR